MKEVNEARNDRDQTRQKMIAYQKSLDIMIKDEDIPNYLELT
jgi:hypothetical protein